MTFPARDIMSMNRGWSGVEILSGQQIEEMKRQIKYYLGIDV